MTCGTRPGPPGSNHSLQAFAIKKDYIRYNHGAAAQADKLRVFIMKNTDNKLVVNFGASSCMPVWISSIVRIQRGFVRGRHLIHNVLDFDSMARLHSLTPSQHIALMALYDFSNLSPVSSIAGFFRLLSFIVFLLA